MSLNIPHLKPLLALALLFTLLNSVKPLHIDDTLYYYRARQAAEHPLAPYDFDIFWNDRPEPAIQILAPPLFPYYWAIAIRLFGERPLLWKLWLLPLALLFVFSLAALFRRFAPGQELALTCMTVLSPTFLPSFNLMLEVPVAALALSSLVLFLRAHDRDSLAGAAAAGLVAGLAMQTKYTAFVIPVLMLLYAFIFRKIRLGLVGAALAWAVFWSIEGLLALGAGHSHLLYQSQVYGSVHLLKKYVYLSWPLVTLMGGLAPALALLAMAALGVRRKIVTASAIAVGLGYLLLAVVPSSLATFSRDAATGEEKLTLAHLIFSFYGLAVYALLGAVTWRLLMGRGGAARSTSKGNWRAIEHDGPTGRKRFMVLLRSYLRDYGTELFLVLWLCVEIGAYFALSPIPAARRMTSLLIVSTLLIGRLASQQKPERRRESLLSAVAFGSILLGLLFYGVDLHDAFVEKMAVESAAQRLDETAPGGRRWYVGRWGFQYYAERAGMRPVIPDESRLEAGDWLVVSDGPYWTSPLAAHLARYRLEPVAHLSMQDSLRLATVLGYYNSGIPIHHQEGPHRSVRIYRVAGPINAPLPSG